MSRVLSYVWFELDRGYKELAELKTAQEKELADAKKEYSDELVWMMQVELAQAHYKNTLNNKLTNTTKIAKAFTVKVKEARKTRQTIIKLMEQHQASIFRTKEEDVLRAVIMKMKAIMHETGAD